MKQDVVTAGALYRATVKAGKARDRLAKLERERRSLSVAASDETRAKVAGMVLAKDRS